MHLIHCLIYIVEIGLLSNVVALFFPRKWFHPDRFPFRQYKWEKKGRIYIRLGIRKWKDRVPDMSKVLPFLYRKKVNKNRSEENLLRLIRETCVAELVHGLLCVAALWVVHIWPGKWGWIFWICYCAGNLPFMMIQRFNRPRLCAALSRMQVRKAVTEGQA